MAEATRQASFGWASEAPAPTEERTAGRRTLPRVRRQVPGAPATQRIPANEAETLLPPDNELWDVRAAARFLKRSVSWVYHRAEDGTLPVKRLDGWGVRFIPGELRAWVDSGAAGRRRR